MHQKYQNVIGGFFIHCSWACCALFEDDGPNIGEKGIVGDMRV